jgi:hypothetical protein
MHGDLVALSPDRRVQQDGVGVGARAVAGSDRLAGKQLSWRLNHAQP